MTPVDELIYNAICANGAIMAAVGNRVVSTCFEVSPDDKDKTQLPNVIVTDDGFQSQTHDKDYVWEGDEDSVAVSVEIAGKSPNEVKTLVRMSRKAVNDYICGMYEDGAKIPILDRITSDGIAWDWTKPCYYQRVTYHCIIDNDYE